MSLDVLLLILILLFYFRAMKSCENNKKLTGNSAVPPYLLAFLLSFLLPFLPSYDASIYPPSTTFSMFLLFLKCFFPRNLL